MTVASPAAPTESRLPYVGTVLLAGLCFSLTGVLVRLLEAASGWQVVVFRSAALALTVALVLALRYRRETLAAFRRVGWLGVLGGCGLAFGTICYIWALYHTTVANTVFLFGALPFFNSFIAWILLGERVPKWSWLAMAVALSGIVVMVGGGLVAGLWLGNLLALVGLLGYSTYTMTLRKQRGIDMLPALCLSGIVGAVVAGALAGDAPVSAHDIGVCVVMGVVSVGLGYSLYTWAARKVRAGELSLLTNVEIILGPIWVWLAVNEVPSATTLMGGALLLAAILAQAAITLRSSPG